jgi:hypothetical protein
MHLADTICREYGVDAYDMKILAAIEEVVKENKPKEPLNLRGD